MQSQSWSLAGLEFQQCVELCKDNKCAKFYQQLTFCFTIQGFCFLLLNSIYSLSPFPRFFFAFFPSSQPFIHSCPSSQSFLSSQTLQLVQLSHVTDSLVVSVPPNTQHWPYFTGRLEIMYCLSMASLPLQEVGSAPSA